MNCKHYRTRTKKYLKYGYCTKYKKEVLLFCRKCNNIEYKKTKPIKKRTSKLAYAENNRKSIITNNFELCIICGKQKNHLHEVFFGRNRQLSIQYGLVIPLCSKCHLEMHKNKELQDIWHIRGQEAFEKTYHKLEFIEIFKRNYK